jgi:hypothetical protein
VCVTFLGFPRNCREESRSLFFGCGAALGFWHGRQILAFAPPPGIPGERVRGLELAGFSKRQSPGPEISMEKQ